MRGDENKIFDDFLRQSLANYQVPPPPGVWTTLKFKLFSKNLWHISMLHSNAGLIGSVSTGVLVTSLTTWYMAGKVDTNIARELPSRQHITTLQHDTVQDQAKTANPINPGSSLKAGELVANSNITNIAARKNTNLPATAESGNAGTAVNKPVTAALVSTATQSPSLPAKRKIKTSARNTENNLNSPNHNNSNTQAYKNQTNTNAGNDPVFSMNTETLERLSEITGLPATMLLASNNSFEFNPLITNSLNREELLQLIKKDLRSHYDYARSPKLEWSAGLGVSPEWLLNNKDGDFAARNIITSITVRGKRQHLFIETGISVYTEKAPNAHNVNYFPYLGTYQNLDSITFVYDSINGPVPTYHYHDIRLYDSVQQKRIVNETARYTFIGIPVMAGYSYDFGRHGFVIKTGPVFNFMISKKVPVPDIDPSKLDNITSVSALDSRNTTAIQWRFEFNYQYALSRRLTLLFGPYYSATLTQPYERKKPATGLPSYFGTKAGLMWNF